MRSFLKSKSPAQQQKIYKPVEVAETDTKSGTQCHFLIDSPCNLPAARAFSSEYLKSIGFPPDLMVILSMNPREDGKCVIMLSDVPCRQGLAQKAFPSYLKTLKDNVPKRHNNRKLTPLHNPFPSC
ncbi:uncharacterized protein MONOS_7025 [Monocercomonoides exilis]|uniref:uncharacterized protein n=1 Tax=Monocercomonoides exilis TaxID=2049356 RepID=UPI003559F1E8|nr:hypothetical protein MONOS_7025 [Monocercomonoides exilis]|eukprot:MONOS_7025.1-p1 / transcript=MONOS_7025.1 / gene=MONOS_7025 / organism=Monocercomonoides_exilis_PA203 / gene_product=unspecified product / transcript_product=unspecified product / location=Mono_scaffold00231:63484-63937(+) / protein_length=126 / sequence_SO=supercontig / SO=protein_coding / is_pseudo=false